MRMSFVNGPFLTVVFDDPVYGERAPDFTEFMAPGMIILIMYFLAMALTAEVFIIERKDGLIDRQAVQGDPSHWYQPPVDLVPTL